MEIIYSRTLPPVYSKCKKQFGVSFEAGMVFTYGNTIHSKFGPDLTDDLKAHEAVHVKQQTKMGVEAWWDRYLADPKFRFEQEKEAYKAQIKYAKWHYPGDRVAWLKAKLAQDMAKLYGKMCTLEQAAKILR